MAYGLDFFLIAKIKSTVNSSSDTGRKRIGTKGFEVAAVILLLAIVAAVALTLRRRKDSKYFDPAAAVKVKRADRIRIVSMKAESDRTATQNDAQTNTEKTGA